MTGDHKCPVCQATFTRPQHVARHMRSHTGDRPYKCQHCGDQFARSDLLSRHVNKCHAHEKPLPSVSGSRRKGSASASRATTSKQACDQCVQSSLPCDGANPCAKCIQRKCRCTFVKFHRQTAPVGPGHNPRPASASGSISISGHPALSASSSTAPRGPIYAQQSDEFLLGPAPSTAETLYAQAFGFPPLYPAPTIHGSDQIDNESYTTKYRAQADLLRRSGGTGLTPLYAPQQQNHHQQEWVPYPQEAYPHGEVPLEKDLNMDLNRHYMPLPMQQRQQLHQTRSRTRRHSDAQDFSSDTTSAGPSNPESVASSSDGHGPPQSGRTHPMSMDAINAINAMNNSMGAINVDPMGMGIGSVDMDSQMGGVGQMNMMTLPPLPFASGNGAPNHSSSVSNPSRPATSGSDQAANPGATESSPDPPRPSTREGFSSAFGLMSLDDPDVLAGLARDGAPFFSRLDSNSSRMGRKHDERASDGEDQTPMGGAAQRQSAVDKQSNSGSSREAETRQLKEFWKQYMRTPLSGPGPAMDTDAAAGEGSNTYAQQGYRNGTPAYPGGTRPRVASFPSARTPMAGEHQGSEYYHGQGQQQQSNRAHGQDQTSSMRTTLYGNSEDLRSYEAAVLARKAPTTLSLAGMRARRGMSQSQAQDQRAHGSQLPVPAPTRQGQGQGRLVPVFKFDSTDDASRGSLGTSSSSSSLAGAFGMQEAQQQRNRQQGYGHVAFNLSQTESPPSRESSLSIDDGASVSSGGSGGAAGDGEAMRPSFKRLPSQTLGPVNSKRVLVTHGWNDERNADEGESGRMGAAMRLSGGQGEEQQTPAEHASDQKAGIAERRRRMSSVV
ncbi:hypothetical protein BD779DRAFT_674752 [Infundibulicybe gibba]|nr:hypothetical protein BD779DRAFT_674752 [Infundibulicybe gibba]